jgi:hypothetical protein
LSIAFKNGKFPSIILPSASQTFPNQTPTPLQDPQNQSDFSYSLTTVPISEIDPGHTCFSIADPPPSTPEGTNATIQIKYTADFDRPENQTFYACADITYVAAANFNSADILCFNATDDEDVPAPTATGTPTNLPGHGAAGPPLDTPESDAQSGSESAGAGGLSKGGIAGAVVGSVLGVALIAGLAFLFYRERQKKMRLVAQRDSGRGVKWVEEPGKDSVSADTIRMGNMS